MAEPQFTYRQTVGAITGGESVPCQIDVLDNPLGQSVRYAWRHDAAEAFGCQFIDTDAQSTEFLPGELPDDALVTITCDVVLGEASIARPVITLVSLTGDYEVDTDARQRPAPSITVLALSGPYQPG